MEEEPRKNRIGRIILENGARSIYVRKTARCNFAECRENVARIVSTRLLDQVFPGDEQLPGVRASSRDNAEERRQDLPPHRASCECGKRGEVWGKGEEDSYVYARPLVLPSQIHEANIGRKNGVEEVKEPATILLLLLLLSRYRSTRFSPDDTTRPVRLNFEETRSRDSCVCGKKMGSPHFRF